MKFRLEFEVPDPDDGNEIDPEMFISHELRMLRSNLVRNGLNMTRTILDYNGNTIGAWDLIPSE